MNEGTDKPPDVTGLAPVQNLGLADRALRTVIGAGMIAVPMMDTLLNDAMIGWHAYSMLLAVYPLMTAMLGWCPVDAAFNIRTCSAKGRNQCGTLPYQIDSVLGHNPVADHGYDHSLTGSHHLAFR